MLTSSQNGGSVINQTISRPLSSKYLLNVLKSDNVEDEK
jgi:hypothetical protein